MPPQPHQQIVFGDTGWAILKMAVDVRKHRTKQIEALINASFDLFPVRHWAISRQSPKADFRMCLKGLLLAFRRHRVVYLLDLGHYSPCLLAQSSPRDSEIYGARLGVTFCSKGCSGRVRQRCCHVVDRDRYRRTLGPRPRPHADGPQGKLGRDPGLRQCKGEATEAVPPRAEAQRP
jgi:hypothetical protein